MHLRTIPHLAETFGVPVGLSDHTMDIAVPVAAVALGACIIEKHFTLSRAVPGPDSAFSLEPHEFRAMVDAVRVAEKALGEVHYGASEREASSLAFRRSLFVVEDIRAGEPFTERNVRSIRPANGLPPKHLPEVLGRRAERELKRGTPLEWADVGPKGDLEDMKRILRKAREVFSDAAAVPISLAALPLGAVVHRRTGKTPPYGYEGMVQLNCRTRGVTNGWIHRWIQRHHPTYELPPPVGALGALTPEGVSGIAAQIDRDGYYIFPQRLAADACERLLAFSQSIPGEPRPKRPDHPASILFDRSEPQADSCWFIDDQALLDNPDIQALLADPSLLSVAQAYLGVPPVLDYLVMWWNAVLTKKAPMELPQYYHFDHIRPKFLKFFFYLTDVTADTGPHCYVTGSHKREGRDRRLTKFAYGRVPDGGVEKHYPADRVKEIVGPQGTIIAVDTSGYHKGKTPKTGDRLILQIQCSDSLFGAEYGSPHIKRDYAPQLREMAARFPRIYARYVLD